ncbi:S49 family peptidase [Maritalea sp.]|jgi:ClpP class serine protease|uniref:S49 family peptidase n=1 Tax=Maritalea sp. TaxID=2003361 RepID=UPI0039E6C17A
MTFSGNWLIDRRHLGLPQLASVLQMRDPKLFENLVAANLGLNFQGADASEVERPTALARGSMAYRWGDVAVVRVFGALSHRFNRYTYSYEEFERDLELASSDEFIGAVLEIDSPGGQCSNLDYAADLVAGFAETKPIEAVISGIGCSAAFWLASAATKTWATRTAMIGSVGSVISYFDMDGILESFGAKKIEITASQSPNKRLDPHSAEGKAEMQAIVDDAGQMFVEALAEYNQISTDQVMERFGQGLVFSAPEALSRGMIDGIKTINEVLAGFAARPNDENHGDRSATVSTSKEHIDMPNKQAGGNTPTPTLAARLESLNASDPELVASIQANAKSEQGDLLAQAAAEERDRIAGIQALAQPGCDDLIAAMIADGKTTPAEAAHRIMTSDEFKKGKTLSALASDDNLASGATPAPSAAIATSDKVEQTPEGWTAEWNASEGLQSKFMSAADYVAMKKREAKS